MVSDDAFVMHNRHYTLTKLKSAWVDPEWHTMLGELREELSNSRMTGPFTSP